MSDSPREPSQVAGYAKALTAFATAVTGLAVVGRLSGRPLRESYGPWDVVLGGLATYKFARVISKDAVTTPIRMPFTEFQETAGSAEVNEKPRDGHPNHTIGELLSCPFCLAPWISSAYVAGLSLAPRWARTWAAVFGMVGISDTLQHLYARVRTD